jgi:hypothetical protein
VFASVSHFHPSLALADKAGAYQSGAPCGGKLLWLTKVEVTDSGKPSSFLITAKFTTVNFIIVSAPECKDVKTKKNSINLNNH